MKRQRRRREREPQGKPGPSRYQERVEERGYGKLRVYTDAKKRVDAEHRRRA